LTADFSAATRRRGWQFVSMNILVTAGNTVVPIDRVRCITNVFTGRTGTGIALECLKGGHAVTLLTSHPELVSHLGGPASAQAERWTVSPYRTFDDLERSLQDQLLHGRFDVLIHCAAVSDYRAAGIFAPAPQTRFVPQSGVWQSSAIEGPALIDKAAAKVKSTEPELWIRLVRTPKLIDRVRNDWRFQGILVKFKLEAGISESALLDIAEHSRQTSRADLMVANTLEDSGTWALLGPLDRRYERVTRADLASRLLAEIERLYAEGNHG